jgi:hypothetical protein
MCREEASNGGHNRSDGLHDDASIVGLFIVNLQDPDSGMIAWRSFAQAGGL